MTGNRLVSCVCKQTLIVNSFLGALCRTRPFLCIFARSAVCDDFTAVFIIHSSFNVNYTCLQRIRVLYRDTLGQLIAVLSEPVIMCGHYLPTVILIFIGILSPTYSFILGLIPSFSANTSHQPFLFFLQVSLHDSLRLLTVFF